VAYLKERFQKLDPEEMAQIQACLKKLQSIFHLPRGQTQDC
jgi:transcriptional regulator, MarR family